jgi:hypothetical protein
MSDTYLSDAPSAMPGADIDPAPDLPRLSDPSEAEALKPGTKFLDPDGKTRVKPWTVRAESATSDLANVPEGEQFVDPDGKLRMKPKFEGIDFTAQTLYDMSVTPSEKKKALERSYPGNVFEDTEGLYVKDNEKFRRPGRGFNAATGFATAAAAPVAGAVLGALGLGAASGGVGAAVGGAGGSLAGQAINDIVLQLSGVYDRSIGEEAANLVKSGAMGMAGAGVGRGIAAVVPAAKAGVSSVGQMLPTMTAKFLGAGPEITAARELSEKGVKVPPSAWAHESPHLQNLVEVFDPAFRTDKPLLKSATEHYEKSATSILDDLGVKREGSITNPEVAVPTQRAGEIVLQKTLGESAAADQKLAQTLAERKAAIEAGIPEKLAQRESVIQAAEESRKKAQALIDQGYADIQKEADAARKIAGSGANTGDLWANIGEKFKALRSGISERARYWYDRYDEMTGGATVTSQPLSNTARQMLEELPPEFKSRNPMLVQKLEKLGAQVDEEGNVVREAIPLTYGQVHELRSLFRGAADWQTLSSDFKNGALKRFSREIDDIIHLRNEPEILGPAAIKIEGKIYTGPAHFEAFEKAKNMLGTNSLKNVEEGWITSAGTFVSRQEALKIAERSGQLTNKVLRDGDKLFYEDINNTPYKKQLQLREAAKFLDMVDKWYGHNVSVFEAQQIKAVMKGLEAGEPADPVNLYKVLVKDGQTDLTRRVRDMVGPNLWAGVRAADTDAMLNAAKTLNPGELDGKRFAAEVVDRHRRGILEAVHGKEEAARLLAQARAIEQLEGRLPIPTQPGDTMTQVIARARMAADEAKALGNKDPLATLSKDVKRVEAELKREAAMGRRTDPLGFLYNKSTGASYAVDKILKDEDLILAAAARFGENSAEFNALRQVYVERVLRGTLEPGARLEKIGPEVQNLMFPGVTGEQMRLLAKEMDLLMNTRANLKGDTAGGMSAMAKVEHPVTNTPIARGAMKLIPGVNPAARAAHGKFYKLVTDLMTSPATLRWIEKGLTQGTPEEQAAVRKILQAHLQKGAAMGAGAGQSVYQGSGD